MTPELPAPRSPLNPAAPGQNLAVPAARRPLNGEAWIRM
jgi:hypothetical protein